MALRLPEEAPTAYWGPLRKYAVFVSQAYDAGLEGRILRETLRAYLQQAPIYLDTLVSSEFDSVAKRRGLVQEGVFLSDAVLLLGTRALIWRPWVLITLFEALQMFIPVVMVRVIGRGWSARTRS